MTTTPSTTMQYIDSIRELTEDYDIFLLDMWGVMHNGSQPYKGVLETVQELKAAGKDMIILSNSSKRTSNSVKMLTKLGFDPSDFSKIITSGEIAHNMLARDTSLGCETWSILSELKGKRVFVFGSGNGDEEYCTSCGWTLSSLIEADLILARGTFTICNDSTIVKKQDDEDKYFRVLQESLSKAASLKIPMLVSNPDKVRPDEGLPPMPGAIGDAYEAMLGDENTRLVKRIGKPFPEVFQLALNKRDKSRAVMIGDALETDVTGGASMGITTVWATNDGIHGPDILEKGSLEEGTLAVLDAFNENDGTYAKETVLRPSYIIPHFRW
jgi:HAD superfamily hydrolase (TIGR01450 family)